MTEWSRGPAWGDADRAEFENRLRRARKDNRPSYLRIKAIYLGEVGLVDDA